MGLSIHQGSTQSWLTEKSLLNKEAFPLLFFIMSTAGTKISTSGYKHFSVPLTGGRVLLVKGDEFFPFPSASLWSASPKHWSQPRLSVSTRAGLCFPVVPVGICCSVRLYWTLRGRAGVLGRLLGLRRPRVQQWYRFIRVEGPAVRVQARGASSWPMLGNPSEVLEWSFSSLMVVGIKLISSSFIIWMPEISSWTMKRVPAQQSEQLKTGVLSPVAHLS